MPKKSKGPEPDENFTFEDKVKLVGEAELDFPEHFIKADGTQLRVWADGRVEVINPEDPDYNHWVGK